MIHEQTWAQGTPAWIDLMVPDRLAAQEFYGPLFGWDFVVGDAETGFYTMALKHGQPVAGLGQSLGGEAAPPSMWTTYLAVDDVDPVVERARAAGGTILMAPMDVMDFGRMAVLADPTGAVVGLWQSGTHTGANLVNEPGALIWNEGVGTDLDAARAFYGAVFGYEFGDMSGPGFDYATISLPGTGPEQAVGGLGAQGALPAGTAPHWRTYFGVADTDAAVAHVVELGGRRLSGPSDSPYGRVARVSGPAGEQFSLMSTSQPESPDTAAR